jgi:hypothetical protein
VTVRCNLGVKQGAGLPLPLQFAEIVAVFLAFERSRCGVRRIRQRFSRDGASVVILLNAVVIVGRGGLLHPSCRVGTFAGRGDFVGSHGINPAARQGGRSNTVDHPDGGCALNTCRNTSF